jgi:hypothetical protein
MKTIKIILAILTIGMLHTVTTAQGGDCKNDKIKVYIGANGCGCKCMKVCVTPAELPVYLANGWNTEGCGNCCFAKNWVDTGTPKTSLEEIIPGASADILTISYTLASESDVMIQITDITGRDIGILVDEHKEDLENEFLWDHSQLYPGVYFLRLSAGGITDTKRISVTN